MLEYTSYRYVILLLSLFFKSGANIGIIPQKQKIMGKFATFAPFFEKGYG